MNVVLAAAAGLVLGGWTGSWLTTNRWRREDEPGHTRVRPWVTAAGLALVFAVIVAQLGRSPWWPAAAAGLVLAAVALPVVVIDNAVRRVPEPLVLTGYGLELATLTAGAAVTGQWSSLARALAGGAVVWGIAFGYSLLVGTGFGDVQLMGLAGLVLGWVGWRPALMSGVVVLVVGGLWAGVLLARGRRGTFAYAPPLLLGVLVTLVLYT